MLTYAVQTRNLFKDYTIQLGCIKLEQKIGEHYQHLQTIDGNLFFVIPMKGAHDMLYALVK